MTSSNSSVVKKYISLIGIVLMIFSVAGILFPLTIADAQSRGRNNNERNDRSEEARNNNQEEEGEESDTQEEERGVEEISTPHTTQATPINLEAEAILNESLPVNESESGATSTPSLPPTVLAPTPATTTSETQPIFIPAPSPTQPKQVPIRQTPQNSRTEESATTTPVQGTTQTPPPTINIIPGTGGQSTVQASTNYYTPLDDLSAGTTYALSFLALGFGIAGILLVMRKPEEEYGSVWLSQFRRGKTLLKT